MLLSTNCKIAIVIPALMSKLVDTVAAIINAGIAPKIGPKYGIISVIPMMMPSNNGYFIPINQKERTDTPLILNKRITVLEYNFQVTYQFLSPAFAPYYATYSELVSKRYDKTRRNLLICKIQ